MRARARVQNIMDKGNDERKGKKGMGACAPREKVIYYLHLGMYRLRHGERWQFKHVAGSSAYNGTVLIKDNNNFELMAA